MSNFSAIGWKFHRFWDQVLPKSMLIKCWPGTFSHYFVPKYPSEWYYEELSGSKPYQESFHSFISEKKANFESKQPFFDGEKIVFWSSRYKYKSSRYKVLNMLTCIFPKIWLKEFALLHEKPPATAAKPVKTKVVYISR